jgi:hypothetical protein
MIVNFKYTKTGKTTTNNKPPTTNAVFTAENRIGLKFAEISFEKL